MADNSALVAALLQQQRRRVDPADESRRFARLLMQQGASTEPVRSPLEGLARALQGAVGGYFEGAAEREQKAKDAATLQGLSAAATAGTLDEQRKALGNLQGGDISILGPALAGLVGERQKQLQSGQHADAFTAGFGNVTNPPTAGAAPGAVTQGGGDITSTPLPGIPAFESSGRYDAVGPVANQQGDRAFGKYQVMGANIPAWTKEVLGQPMTPEQFLADPKAQDAVYNAKIGQFRQQTGSDDGARAMWFSGQPNPASGAKDVNGVTVAQYVQRTGGGPQVAQGDAPPRADASGTPLPPATAVPDVPRPQPSPEQVKKYEGMIRDGSLTAAQARQALDQELTQEWMVQRENRRMQWQQEQENQRIRQKADLELQQTAPMTLIKDRMANYENKVRPAAMTAINEIPVIHQARQVLDAGAFTGTGADAKLMLAKIGEQLGIPSQDAQNTQVLGSILAKRTLAAAGGTLGTGFSNADRDFMENASGGRITLDEGAIRKILDIGERQARQTIANHDTETKRMAKMPGVAQLGPDYLALPTAPTYEEWSKANLMPGAQQPNVSRETPARQIPTLTDPSQVKNLKSGDQFYTPDGRLKVVP